jgi:hypothetical protein
MRSWLSPEAVSASITACFPTMEVPAAIGGTPRGTSRFRPPQVAHVTPHVPCREQQEGNADRGVEAVEVRAQRVPVFAEGR